MRTPRSPRSARRIGLAGLCALVLLLSTAAVHLQPAQQPAPDDRPAEPIRPLPAPPHVGSNEVALGAALFADRRLSGSGRLACASCHDLQTNGADAGQYRSRSGIDGIELATLSVFNAGLSYRLGWQGRFHSLEDQAAASLTDPDVMGSTRQAVVDVVRGDPVLRGRFRAAYGRDPDWAGLVDAIATFERSLLTPGSRFDRWLSGDTGALTPQELDGYQLFKSFGCVSCHQGVNIGTNLFERSGVFHELAAGPAPLLRVPSLRNIAVLGPYFHDGSAPTLSRAVTVMGWVQLNRDLSRVQVDAIVAFLNSLTGRYDGNTLVPAR